ncbi:MAG TPA: hypothetical protein ENJ52_10235 [Aliiroseovarius sp.]|nr:hypothetical protein [Aliiroseovarius sp.]
MLTATGAIVKAPSWRIRPRLTGRAADGNAQEDGDRLDEIKGRLARHLIPVDEALAEITGDNVEDVAQQAAEVFDAFLTRRAELVHDEIDRLVAGNEG